MSVYIDCRLWEMLVDEFKKTSFERAFYLIGFKHNDNFYVYEAFEFAYMNQSEAFIESDPKMRLLLVNILPPGLKILGIAHSHPFDSSDSPQPSQIDEALCIEYQGAAVLTVSRTCGVKAIIFDQEMKSLDVKIKKFDIERPRVIGVRIPYKYYCVFPYFLTKFERMIYIPKIVAEHVYRMYLAGKYDGKKLDIPQYTWVWIKQIFALPHKICVDYSDEVLKYIKLTGFSRIVLDENMEVDKYG